jgi:hypothetical protein
VKQAAELNAVIWNVRYKPALPFAFLHCAQVAVQQKVQALRRTRAAAKPPPPLQDHLVF